MKVALDARILSYNRTGLYRYGIGLITALTEFSLPFDFLVLLSGLHSVPNLPVSLKSRKIFTPAHFRFEKFTLPLELRGLDLIHALDFYVPVGENPQSVFTVHDLYFLHEPKSVADRSYAHYRKLLDYVNQAGHIICDSICTKRDLLQFAQLPEERISVIYPGAPEIPRDADSSISLIDGDYFLFVGSLEKRKNLVRLVEAYSTARRRQGLTFPKLVLAGKEGFGGEEVVNAIRKLNVQDSVIPLGECSDKALQKLYSRAKALVYVSLYEGFGFPILEAMARGIPVITAARSAMSEISADAALLVDPYDVQAIADALEKILEDKELRQRLVTRGEAKLAQFTWQSTARQTIDVYRRVLQL